MMRVHRLPFLFVVAMALPFATQLPAAQLLVGTATVEITPTPPIGLIGSFSLRVAKRVETPLTANVVALESRDGDKTLDVAVMVACDLCVIRDEMLLRMVREEVSKRIPGLDTDKIFLNATHTHTVPFTEPGAYLVPEEVTSAAEYRAFFVQQVAKAIDQAWNGRAPGSVTWGLGHAVVAYGRRALYADGSARMYAATDVPEFRGIEGYEDHAVSTLFFWNEADKLIAVCIHVPAPAQAVEGRLAVNADFWYPVYESLRQRHGDELCVLAWCGAAGDQSPRPMFNQAAEARMMRLRGLDSLGELARRIVQAVNDTYEVVKDQRRSEVPLVHHVETIQLPRRRVSEAEYEAAKAARQQAADAIAKDPRAADHLYRRMNWQGRVVERYEAQKDDPQPTYAMELHVLRLGDVAICTNSFELFTEYGVRIQSRSKALQTFVIQLAGYGTYVPTDQAVRAGGYGTEIMVSIVGPEGGRFLVDKTIEVIESLWKE